MKFLYLFLILGSLVTHAQTSETMHSSNLQEGVMLIRSGQWIKAQESINTFIKRFGTSKETDYYMALCELNMGSTDALWTVANDFTNNKYPDLAKYHLTQYYFNHALFETVISLVPEIDSNLFTKEVNHQLSYYYAYALFQSEKVDEALVEFKLLSTVGGDTGAKACFYAGSILYDAGNYREAVPLLRKVNIDELNQLAAVPLTNALLQLAAYEELLNIIDLTIGSVNPDIRSKLYATKGECHFILKDYEAAARAFQLSVDLSGNASNEMLYKTGLAHEKAANYDLAIQNYKLVALENSAIGHQATFNLGRIYLTQEKMDHALGAFRLANQLDFQDTLKAKSLFLNGKMEAHFNNFARSIVLLEEHIANFPTSFDREEAEEILAEAYIRTSNYDAAIRHVESLDTHSFALQSQYQRTCFLRGSQLFNDQQFEQALELLHKALRYKIDPNIVYQTYFLLGEVYSTQNKLEKAISNYLKINELNIDSSGSGILNDVYFGLGHAYFNLGQYDKARSNFSKITSESKQFRIAQTKKADCDLTLSSYEEAIKTYNYLIYQDRFEPYLNYQLGLAYVMTNDFEQARACFQIVANHSPTSQYADNAFVELGQTYFENGQFDMADSVFSSFITQYQTSALVPFAHLKRGLCRSNRGMNSAAEKDFKLILDEFAQTEQSKEALLGLSALNRKGYLVTDYNSYLDAYRQSNPNDQGLEVIEFEQLKSAFFSQEYTRIYTLGNEFLAQYPGSMFKPDVYYYMGDAFFRIHEWEKSVESFDSMISYIRHPYYGRSLDKRGRALLASNQTDRAFENYQQLLRNSSTIRELYQARYGLMITHFETNQMDSVIHYARELLASEWKPMNSDLMAYLFIGKGHKNLHNLKTAEEAFQTVIENSLDIHAAEATYHLAEIHFLLKEFDQSIELLFELIEKFSTYDSWVDKAYLLMADNYLQLNELIQAEATLNSIIEFANNDELSRQAQMRLDSLLVSQYQSKPDTIND